MITLTPEYRRGGHDLIKLGGWNTERMERVRHQHPSWGSTSGKVRRWLLLGAVIAGIFGMHVLTAEDGTSRHGALPMMGTAGHDMTGHDISPAGALPSAMDAAGGMAGVAAVIAADPGSGGDHGAMVGCILFLAVGAAALILLLLLRLRGGPGTSGIGRLAGTAVSDMRRRGPPGRWPRLALCVIRV